MSIPTIPIITGANNVDFTNDIAPSINLSSNNQILAQGFAPYNGMPSTTSTLTLFEHYSNDLPDRQLPSSTDGYVTQIGNNFKVGGKFLPAVAPNSSYYGSISTSVSGTFPLNAMPTDGVVIPYYIVSKHYKFEVPTTQVFKANQRTGAPPGSGLRLIVSFSSSYPYTTTNSTLITIPAGTSLNGVQTQFPSITFQNDGIVTTALATIPPGTLVASTPSFDNGVTFGQCSNIPNLKFSVQPTSDIAPSTPFVGAVPQAVVFHPVFNASDFFPFGAPVPYLAQLYGYNILPQGTSILPKGSPNFSPPPFNYVALDKNFTYSFNDSISSMVIDPPPLNIAQGVMTKVPVNMSIGSTWSNSLTLPPSSTFGKGYVTTSEVTIQGPLQINSTVALGTGATLGQGDALASGPFYIVPKGKGLVISTQDFSVPINTQLPFSVLLNVAQAVQSGAVFGLGDVFGSGTILPTASTINAGNTLNSSVPMIGNVAASTQIQQNAIFATGTSLGYSPTFGNGFTFNSNYTFASLSAGSVIFNAGTTFGSGYLSPIPFSIPSNTRFNAGITLPIGFTVATSQPLPFGITFENQPGSLLQILTNGPVPGVSYYYFMAGSVLDVGASIPAGSYFCAPLAPSVPITGSNWQATPGSFQVFPANAWTPDGGISQNSLSIEASYTGNLFPTTFNIGIVAPVILSQGLLVPTTTLPNESILLNYITLPAPFALTAPITLPQTYTTANVGQYLWPANIATPMNFTIQNSLAIPLEASGSLYAYAPSGATIGIGANPPTINSSTYVTITGNNVTTTGPVTVNTNATLTSGSALSPGTTLVNNITTSGPSTILTAWPLEADVTFGASGNIAAGSRLNSGPSPIALFFPAGTPISPLLPMTSPITLAVKLVLSEPWTVPYGSTLTGGLTLIKNTLLPDGLNIGNIATYGASKTPSQPFGIPAGMVTTSPISAPSFISAATIVNALLG